MSNRSWGSYGAAMMSPRSEDLDGKMPKKMRDICNEWIVATHQFDEMDNPAGALMCARVLRMFLIFFIVTSTIGLITGFIFKASLAAPVETEQFSTLAAPSVVFCASPWGANFKDFKVDAVEMGVIPGPAFHAINPKNWTTKAFNSTLGMESASLMTGCKYVKLKDVMLKPRGYIARYSGFETIRVSVDAQTPDGWFNFGFCNMDNEMPQRWHQGHLGTRNTGEIKYEQVNVGATEVSEGVPRSILDFASAGSVPSKKTELEYYYGYFMVRVLSAQAKGISLFSMIAFILLVAAAVNNCGLFELFFVEYVPDDEEPPTLEPNILCRATFGRCFAACRRRQCKMADEADEAEAETKA